MKKTIAIFFLVSIMVSSTHIIELAKIPSFVRHFSEHRSEDSQMSFFTFIVKHYMSGDINDYDYAQDMKLPFKTLISNSTTIVLYSHSNNFTLQPVYTDLSAKPPGMRTKVFKTSSFTSNIWQPPRPDRA